MDPRPVPGGQDTLTARSLALALGLASLAACLVAPAVYFRGSLGEDAMKIVFLTASVTWFTAASYWSFSRR